MCIHAEEIQLNNSEFKKPLNQVGTCTSARFMPILRNSLTYQRIDYFRYL